MNNIQIVSHPELKWNGNRQKRNVTDAIVIHHSANENDNYMAIHNGHIAKGYIGGGYNFVVEKNGVINELRGMTFVGAHCYGYNSTTIGICLPGNYSVGVPPDYQLKSCALLIKYLMTVYGTIPVVKHSDLLATECPGTKFPWDKLTKYINEEYDEMTDETVKKIIESCTNGLLHSEDEVNEMIDNKLRAKDEKETRKNLTDVEDWAKAEIEKLQKTGFLKGSLNGDVDKTIKQIEVLCVMARMFDDLQMQLGNIVDRVDNEEPDFSDIGE